MESLNEKIVLTRPLAAARMRSLPRLTDEVRQYLSEQVEEAFARGQEKGEALLRDQLVSQRNEMIQLQNGVLKSLQETVPNVVRDTEQTLIELALAAAERLVAGLPVDRAMVEAAVREGLSQIEEGGEIHVHLNPGDLKLLQDEASELLKNDSRGAQLQFHGDSNIGRGGCVVRTRFGDVDGRRETKLERIRKTVSE